MKKAKKKRTLCDKITIFSIVITVLSCIVWIILFNINNMMGAPTFATEEEWERINEPKKENLSILFCRS